MSSESPARDRAQAEPTVALAAVFAVALGVSVYAGVLAGALPDADRDLAEPTLRRLHERVTSGGVADPARLRTAAASAGPSGYELNATLGVDGRRWSVGPNPPETADAADGASRPVSVRLGPGRVRPGRLRAEVWT